MSTFMFYCKRQRAGRASSHTLSGAASETFGDRAIERDLHANIETTTDKGQSELLTRFSSGLDTETAVDTLAGFVNDFRMLDSLDKRPAFALESTRPGFIFLGVFPELTIVCLPTVAMQTSRQVQIL